MNAPNMTKEQLKELKDLERRLQAAGRDIRKIGKRTAAEIKESSTGALLKLERSELRRAANNLTRAERAHAAYTKRAERGAASEIKGINKVAEQIKARIAIVSGRVSS